ncbi:MAG TPA: N-acetyltransferase [bacterium]|nr:N-acetyltransferase [bacterium]
MTPFSLRASRAGDRRALALVYQAAFSGEGPWTLRAAEARVAQVLKSKQPAWTACVYGQPVGFLFLSLREGHSGPYGEVTELAVHPYFQGQGIGRKLVRVARTSRWGRKLKTLYGLVYHGPAEGFLRQNGFKPSRRAVVMSLHGSRGKK